MKYSVKIDNKTYSVEIEDLYSRPVIARVDGVPIEIWPEQSLPTPPVVSIVDKEKSPLEKPPPLPSTGYTPTGITLDISEVRAPIPGVIISVMVKSGQKVEYGQELFLIEAMKMRNSIRASRTGVVAEVLVTQGQTVNHNDVLLRFEE